MRNMATEKSFIKELTLTLGKGLMILPSLSTTAASVGDFPQETLSICHVR